MQASFESVSSNGPTLANEQTQKALRIATERAVAAAADEHPSMSLIADEAGTEEGDDKPKQKKKKKNKGKKKRKPKPAPAKSAPEAAEAAAAPPANGAEFASEAETDDTTATEPTEDESNEEPDFSGGVLIGRDGQLVEYVREV